MGDRGNIYVKQEEGGVYLYGHWSGYDMPSVIQRALKRKLRWDDEAYLARILFDELTADSHGEETGFGISTGICDNEHAIFVVDVPNQLVGVAPQPALGSAPELKEFWTFAKFIKLPVSEMERLGNLPRDCEGG